MCRRCISKLLLEKLTLLVAERNHRSTRNAAAHRFLPRQPVLRIDSLLADLLSDLRNPGAPLIMVIAGMGGLGKTTLA